MSAAAALLTIGEGEGCSAQALADADPGRYDSGVNCPDAGQVSLVLTEQHQLRFMDVTPVKILAIVLSSSFLTATLVAQSTVDEWNAKALKTYPELGVKSSPLNAKFLKLYNERKQANPNFFKDPKWPMLLANEVAAKDAADTPTVPSAPPKAAPEMAKPAAFAAKPPANPPPQPTVAPPDPNQQNGAADLQFEVSKIEVVSQVSDTMFPQGHVITAKPGSLMYVVTLVGKIPPTFLFTARGSAFEAAFESPDPKRNKADTTINSAAYEVEGRPWVMGADSVGMAMFPKPGELLVKVAFGIPNGVKSFTVRYPVEARGKVVIEK